MFPILFEIPLPGGSSFPVSTYGLFVALGFLAALLLVKYRAAKAGYSFETAMDLCIWGMISGMLGAKITYIITNWSDFKADLWSLSALRTGFVFYGGVVVGALGMIIYIRYRKFAIRNIADLIIPAMPLAHALGRIGCFCFGCCYGKPTGMPWGVSFPGVYGGLHVHPTQLYSVILNFGIFAFLIWRSPRKKFVGELLPLYLISYAVGRFIIEIFRGDDRGPMLFGSISVSQQIAMIGLIIGVMLYLTWRKLPPPPPDRDEVKNQS